LMAKTPNGNIPLAVASYPGKGRAIWIFSDVMWRLAMSTAPDAPRQAYADFFRATFDWLLRLETTKAFSVNNFSLAAVDGRGLRWQAYLRGPVATYFRPGEDWSVKLCGQLLSTTQLNADQLSAREWHLSGNFAGTMAPGELCSLEISGHHPAFGSAKAQALAIVPAIMRDTEVGAAPQKLRELSQLTGAKLLVGDEAVNASVDWLEKVAERVNAVVLPQRYENHTDHYWFLTRWWFWLLVAMMPLEVLVRRWPKIVGNRG